ncbi:MAG TPA: HAMP domain-containing histidine kinase [Candidatus Flavonifractor merdavium]|nr:HAMP domain-containing histidine kinase [Candidatus Flavonifractor merdavium]
MIRRLRRKFILINLLLVGVVLTVVFVLLVASNARRYADQSQAAMRMALSWREDENPRFEIGAPPPDHNPSDEGSRFTMVPVFVVTVEDGVVTSINDGGQVEVSRETAELAAAEALASGEDSGILRRLNLRFQLETRPDGTVRVAFADQSWESSSLRTLILNCLLVWALAMAAFFFVGLFLSSLALRPVETAWKQQRQFVADASHELKTPLTVILANTGIVLAHPSDTVSAQSKWLEYTQEEARQMKGLVEDLLFLAKSDAARQEFQTAQVDLSELVQGCLLPFEPVAFEAGVRLDAQVDPGLILTGDEAQLRRLVRILLDNGVKYADAEGAVSLTLTRQQDKLRLTVRNTGAPIPPEHLPHLFERFYRADAARNRAQGGYGLGLAIAKAIVEHHRGRISVSSAVESGTVFTVLLPKST